MIHAEISIYPIGTGSTNVSFYIAKAIESIRDFEGIRYQVNPMGTILESTSVDRILEASKKIMETVHNLGVNRVELILKIDSRIDKSTKLEDKMESLKKQMN